MIQRSFSTNSDLHVSQEAAYTGTYTTKNDPTFWN